MLIKKASSKGSRRQKIGLAPFEPSDQLTANTQPIGDYLLWFAYVSESEVVKKGLDLIPEPSIE